MIQISKYTNLIEEQLLKANQRKDVDNSLLKNIILDSFLLGHISGSQRDSRVKYSEFKRDLEVVQQLRNLIEINAFKNEQLIELYNNVFINFNHIQDEYDLIEFQLFDEQDNFNQKEFPIKQQNINTQKKSQNQSYQQLEQEQDENKELQKEIDEKNQGNLKLDLTKDCEICFVKLDPEEIKVLNCGHVYHLNCLNQTCLTQMQSRYFPIFCPNQYCKKAITQNELAKILDKEDLQLYQELTFQSHIESHGDEYSRCPTPDCKFVFISEGENHFKCPVCNRQYCLNCKVKFHKGQTCEQYMSFKNMNKEDQQFYNFIKGSTYKQCPKCKFWIGKNKGCNHMTCRCKFEFCYTCGQDYREQCKCKDNYHIHWNQIFQNQQRFRNNQF